MCGVAGNDILDHLQSAEQMKLEQRPNRVVTTLVPLLRGENLFSFFFSRNLLLVFVNGRHGG